MIGRDLVWRGGGLALSGAAIAIGATDRFGTSVSLLCFCLTIVGIVLIVQGKRVPAAWRVERSRHRTLPHAIHARGRRRPGSEQS